jgi:hypothetical protein
MVALATIRDRSPAPGPVGSRHASRAHAKTRQPVRRTIRDSADIEFVPTENGEMTPADIRVHILATPDSFMSVDRPLTGGMSAGVILLEIHTMCAALLESGAPIPDPGPAGYDDCSIGQQHADSSDATPRCPFALVSCEM